MPHEETIKRIQELVPSVMELEFGCEVEYNQEKFVFISGGMAGLATIFNNRCHAIHQNFHEITILGKPITLAVVLRAIIENDGLPVTFLEAEKEEIGHDWSDMMFRFRDMNWNLSKDNFNDQSEETKTFIGGLLGNK